MPWLRGTDTIHVERLYETETEQILGSSDCPFSTQVRLNGLGYSCGAVDGSIGPLTTAAISDFQRDRNLVVDGDPNSVTQRFLRQAFDGPG